MSNCSTNCGNSHLLKTTKRQSICSVYGLIMKAYVVIFLTLLACIAECKSEGVVLKLLNHRNSSNIEQYEDLQFSCLNSDCGTNDLIRWYVDNTTLFTDASR
jgi:hypothetical protein